MLTVHFLPSFVSIFPSSFCYELLFYNPTTLFLAFSWIFSLGQLVICTILNLESSCFGRLLEWYLPILGDFLFPFHCITTLPCSGFVEFDYLFCELPGVHSFNMSLNLRFLMSPWFVVNCRFRISLCLYRSFSNFGFSIFLMFFVLFSRLFRNPICCRFWP